VPTDNNEPNAIENARIYNNSRLDEFVLGSNVASTVCKLTTQR
jgi:hypothetical protein